MRILELKKLRSVIQIGIPLISVMLEIREELRGILRRYENHKNNDNVKQCLRATVRGISSLSLTWEENE